MRCQSCDQGVPILAPKLRASGYASPRDLLCPICNTYYDSSTGEPFYMPKEGPTPEERQKRARQRRFDRMSERAARQLRTI